MDSFASRKGAPPGYAICFVRPQQQVLRAILNNYLFVTYLRTMVSITP